MKESKTVFKTVLKILGFILLLAAIFFGLVLLFAGPWVNDRFGSIPFEQVIFTLTAPLEGTETDYVSDFIQNCMPIPAIITIVFGALILLNKKFKWTKGFFSGEQKNKKLLRTLTLPVVGVVVFCVGLCSFLNKVRYFEYLDNRNSSSTFYEEYYVDARDVNFTFPEQKRNLVYIFLESMETTYEDTENGGYMDPTFYSELYGAEIDGNRIRELTDLANENLTFKGDNNEYNGFYVPDFNNWTVAAMIGQTAGIPLNVSAGGNDYVDKGSYIPGAYSLGDILHANGYRQELLIGSEGIFGGRYFYFRSHGQYDIVDYTSAIMNRWIAPRYRVWWGYEDEKLFEYAKIELTELAASGQPFNFTTLTADTHFEDGYICDDCVDAYNGDVFSMVMACSSKRVTDFVHWIQEQPWYENTTIVVAGDHKSMDTDWFDDIDPSYQRKGYYVIINPAIQPETNESRAICTYDLYPTTLAAMGITFDSDRLGLGTNLFTTTPTLTEKFGFEDLNKKLMVSSDYYDNHILKGADLPKNEK